MRLARPPSAFRQALARVGLVLILAILLVGLPVANLQLAQRAGLGEAHRLLWLAARAGLEQGANPYQPEAMAQAYQAAFGMPPPSDPGGEALRFRQPPPVLLLGALTMWAPYTLARALWLTILQICLVLLVLVGLALVDWRPRPLAVGVLLAGMFLWRYGLQTMLLGTSDPLVILLLVAGLTAVHRRTDLLAAGLLALASMRPDLALPAVVYVGLWALVRRRWLVAFGLVGAIVIVWGGSLGWQPRWVAHWLAGGMSALRVGGPSTPLTRLAPGLGSLLLATPLVGLTLWAWLASFRQGLQAFAWACAVTLVATATLLAPPDLSSALLAVPALLLSFRVWVDRWGATGAVGVSIVGGLLLAVPWASFWASDSTGPAAPVVIWLPLMLSIASLLWVRWWVVEGRRFPRSDSRR